MSKNLRISLIGLAGAVAGFALQGCFATQPIPECTVTTTAVANGLVPYYTRLSRVDGTGPCAELTHFYTGLQRFRKQGTGGDFTLAIKSSPVIDPFMGYVYSADTDPTNDCVNGEDCQGDADPTAACVVNVSDGGVELFDGTPIAADGTVDLADGGSYQVDPANECVAVDDPVERRDPADPKGANLNAIGQMPRYPINNLCAVTDIVGGVQNYGPETLDLADGTQTTLPAITYNVEYTNFNVVNSAKVLGNAFTADVKYTEGSCVANYKAVGFWVGLSLLQGTADIKCTPAVPADAGLVYSTDCDPSSDLDAGRVFGSGINPAFQPMCDLSLGPTPADGTGVCVPSVDVTTIK